MHDLRVLDQQRLEDRDADAAAEIAHQAAHCGPLRQDMSRQVRQRERVQRDKGAAEAEALQHSRHYDGRHTHL